MTTAPIDQTTREVALAELRNDRYALGKELERLQFQADGSEGATRMYRKQRVIQLRHHVASLSLRLDRLEVWHPDENLGFSREIENLRADFRGAHLLMAKTFSWHQ